LKVLKHLKITILLCIFISSSVIISNTQQLEANGNDNTKTANTKQGLPKNYWIPYNQGGFGTLSETATNGDEGIHNMIRATITSEIYYNLSQNFNFFGSPQKLGNNKGDSITGFIVIPTTPEKFSNANNYLGLGYSSHRGWNNVWKYQSSGRFGAGMHDRSQNMARFTPFPEQRIETADGTIEAILRYTVNNTIFVTLHRLQDGLSKNPVFRTTSAISLPIEMSVNRWNGPGTRINDYHAVDCITIIHGDKGPLAAWNIKNFLQTP
jgi:hypothetical protein